MAGVIRTKYRKLGRHLRLIFRRESKVGIGGGDDPVISRGRWRYEGYYDPDPVSPESAGVKSFDKYRKDGII